jgi:lauroyl/myristoyl acyltransferase
MLCGIIRIFPDVRVATVSITGCEGFSARIDRAGSRGKLEVVTLRHIQSWKPWFYEVLIPALGMLGPARGDAVLGGLGRLLASWPLRRAHLRAALTRAREALGAGWDVAAELPRLEANVTRFMARDTPLDSSRGDDFFGRVEVRGEEHLRAALAQGRGVILAGSHLGPHLVASHWLYRREFELRMLIQRPAYVSRLLNKHWDAAVGPLAQEGFFLNRELSSEEGSKRIFRTRAALREGMAVYLKADVPWIGSNTRPGRLLGYERTFQSLWAEFAALFRTPVVVVFCTHLPGGRYSLTFDPAWTVARGQEGAAVERYLARLEAEIIAHPADAVGHLLWPCYGPPSDRRSGRRASSRLPMPQTTAA